jgi:acyl carrier protein
MNKNEINLKVKEVLITVLNLKMNISDLRDDQLLFGNEDDPGLFEDSLCVLEVTSALIAEFDIEASSFNGSSFISVSSLVECIHTAIEDPVC